MQQRFHEIWWECFSGRSAHYLLESGFLSIRVPRLDSLSSSTFEFERTKVREVCHSESCRPTTGSVAICHRVGIKQRLGYSSWECEFLWENSSFGLVWGVNELSLYQRVLKTHINSLALFPHNYLLFCFLLHPPFHLCTASSSSPSSLYTVSSAFSLYSRINCPWMIL